MAEEKKNTAEVKVEDKASGVDVLGVRVPWAIIVIVLLAALYYYYHATKKSIVSITMPEFNAPLSSVELPTLAGNPVGL